MAIEVFFLLHNEVLFLTYSSQSHLNGNFNHDLNWCLTAFSILDKPLLRFAFMTPSNRDLALLNKYYIS